MKKEMLFVSIVLMSILLIGFSSAMEKTKIYGNLDPGINIKVYLTYIANAVQINNQMFSRDTNNIGDWELKFSSDSGTIDVKIIYKGEEKDFEVMSGTDYKIDWYGDTSGITTGEEKELIIVSNETEEENSTEETINEDQELVPGETTQEEVQETEQEKNIGIIGNVVGETSSGSSEGFLSKLKGLTLLWVILGIFVLLVASNLASSIVLNRINNKKMYGETKEHKEPKIVKLSDKIKEYKEQQGIEHKEIEESEPPPIKPAFSPPLTLKSNVDNPPKPTEVPKQPDKPNTQQPSSSQLEFLNLPQL